MALVRVDNINSYLKKLTNFSHGLIELVLHTVHLFEHETKVSELIMEIVHQILKSWFETNTHPD